jgi:hypothetical protein
VRTFENVPMPVDFTIRDLMRFWSFVDRQGHDECWPWTGALLRSTDHYGSVYALRGKFGLRGRVYLAYRVA